MRNSSDLICLKQSLNWLDADTETPISLFLKMVGSGDGILFESAEVDGRWGRYSLLACDYLLLIRCRAGKLELELHDERLEPLRQYSGMEFMEGMRYLLRILKIETDQDKGKALPPITKAIYGYFGFGMVSVFNPHMQKSMPIDDASACLALPGTLLLFDHLYNRLCQLSLIPPREIPEQQLELDSPQPISGAATATPDANGYKRIVAAIREKLRQGEAIQVVPSTRFCAPFTGSAFSLYRRLRKFNPSPYMFYIKFPDLTLFGSSPEVMVRCVDNELELSPIAGTRKRGGNPEEDRRLESELKADPKDRAEHVMLVDLGRNDLGRIARPGSVKVREYMQTQKFSHVMHLTSEIVADLKATDEAGRKTDALDVLAATFPAGTVSGAPKFRAMEIIRELEGQDRGPYAGCVGWIGLAGEEVNLDMGITIRSMWQKDGRICWQAGGGIVHDSDAELEWQEVWNKSAIMRLALNLEDKGDVSVNR